MKIQNMMIARFNHLRAVRPIDKYADPLAFATRACGISYDGPYAYIKRILQSTEPDHLVCKGSQLGFSTAGISIVLTAALKKRSGLYVLPSASTISDFSQGRVDAAMEASGISQYCTVDNVGLKVIAGTPIYFRGVGTQKSGHKLQEVPIKLLILDERDDILAILVELARERLTGSMDGQEFDFSTPRLPDTGIYAELRKRDQYRYLLKCLHCGEKQVLEIELNVDVEGKFYFCQHCKRAWSHEEKCDMLSRGAWELTQKGDGRAGDHISQLYSPTVTAVKFCQAMRDCEGDETKTQIFYNSKAGLPYEAKGSRLTESEFNKCVGEFSGRGYRVAGIDVSSAGLHYCVIAEDTEFGLHVLDAMRLPWEGLPGRLESLGAKTVVLDAMPEAKASKDLCAALVNAYRCYYPNMRDTISIDEQGRSVNANRTEFFDAVYARFRNDRILISQHCSNRDELRAHLQSQVRCYREGRDGKIEAYYTETGPDHYSHALLYAEVATRLPKATGNETIAGKFI